MLSMPQELGTKGYYCPLSDKGARVGKQEAEAEPYLLSPISPKIRHLLEAVTPERIPEEIPPEVPTEPRKPGEERGPFFRHRNLQELKK